MIKIAPSLLAADFRHLARDLEQTEQGGADYLHLDIMDGHFVPNISYGPAVVAALRPKSRLLFDVHLMIERPERYISEFVRAGADLITVHVETCPHLHRTIQMIREEGVLTGVALNPSTPLCTLEEVLGDLDLVLIMSVNPGFGGQTFIPESLDKIRRLKEMINRGGYRTLIQVDGGINMETAKSATEAGAQVLVAGSAIFGQENVANAVRSLRDAVESK